MLSKNLQKNCTVEGKGTK